MSKRRKRRSLQDAVHLAERLAEQNDGVLPTTSWLRKHGHEWLLYWFRKYPQALSHIKRGSNQRSLVSAVCVAETLAKEHGGELPATQWLRDNGHFWLSNLLYKKPAAFAHLRQNKKYKSLDDAVAIAEQLAEDNGGVLPHVQWLLDHGYDALYRQMQRNPKRFVHIKHKKAARGKYKSVKWLETAEQLARENGGLLPTPTWLLDNGYKALYAYIKANPDLFAHVPRAKRKNKAQTNE